MRTGTAGLRGRPVRPVPGTPSSDPRRGMPPGRDLHRDMPRQATSARGASGPLGERVLRFLAAVSGLCAVASFPASALFSLDSIEVQGNRAVPASQLLGQIGLAPGDSAFRVNAFQIRARLRSDPRVDEVWVSLGFPHRLTVTVHERAPVAALSVAGGYVLLDEDGVVIARTPGPAPYLSLRVDGLDPRSVQIGTVVPDSSVRLGAGVAGRLPGALRQQVIGVRVDAGGEVVLQTRDGIAVRLGGADGIAERLAQVPDVLAAVRARGMHVEHVDMRFPGSVIVRPVGAAAGPHPPGPRGDSPRPGQQEKP